MRSTAFTLCSIAIYLTTVSCNPAKSTTDTVYLMQNHWVLVEIRGQPIIREGANKRASLEFTAEGNKVTGSTGCNRMFGTYTLSGDEKIRFNNIGSTRMACPDMSTENAFLKTLDSTNAYGISGKELLLKNDEMVIARLRAEPLN